MAGTQKLSYGGNTATFSPRAGYDEPNVADITHRVSLGGKLFSYIWNYTDSYEIPLNNISVTDAQYFESWRVAGYDLTFIPDYDALPGSSITVRIINKTNPMRMMAHQGFNGTALYEGVLSLRKITAN